MAQMINQIVEGVSDERQLVTFRLGKDEFSIDIMKVREIIRFTEVIKVPQAPSYVEGVCNLRGDILPVIDGRTRLGLERRAKDNNTRVVVIDLNGQVMGIVVDQVSEVLRVSETEVEVPPSVVRNLDEDYLNGVVKLDGGNRLIMSLNLEEILKVAGVEENRLKMEAAYLAATNAQEEKVDIDEEQLVSFLLGQEEYTFDIKDVKEIIRVPEITAIPNASQFIEGVVSIRNHLIPIINMRSFFNLPEQEVTDQSRVIIADLGQVAAGFRVDRVAEVVRVPKDVIEPPPAVFAGEEAGQIRGVAKLNGGKRLLMCLNSKKMLSLDIVQELMEGEAGQVEKAEVTGGAKNILEEEQLVAFKLGKEEFAIKINDIQEINRMPEVIKVPNAPYYIDGLVNLRGNIIPALNLRTRFGMNNKQGDEATRIVIADLHGRKTGIIVDSVSEVLRFDSGLVEETPQLLTSAVEAKYISGVAKLNSGKRMVMILNMGEVLENGSPAREQKLAGNVKQQPELAQVTPTLAGDEQ